MSLLRNIMSGLRSLFRKEQTAECSLFCAPCHRNKGFQDLLLRENLSNSPKPGASIRLHDWFRNYAPTRVFWARTTASKSVRLENMAINSTHFQSPDLDDFCATVFATTQGRFDVSGTCLNTGDSFKWKQRLENKRHTNTYLPLTSHSPIGVSIPRSPPDFPSCV